MEVSELTLQEPVIVGLIQILYAVLQMRVAPGSSTATTRLLSDGECHTLIKGTAIECHLTSIRAARNADMLGVNLGNLRT